MKKTNSFAIILSLILLLTQVTPALAAAPVITINPIAIVVNEGTTIVIDATATITDADSPANFNGGYLIIHVTNSPELTDNLTFTSTTTPSTSYSRTGIPSNWSPNGTVSFNGVQFGSYVGWNTSLLTFTFNANATPTIVQGLLQRIRYQEPDNTPSNPGPLARTVYFEFHDGTVDPGNPATDTVTITVTPINDSPVVSWGWNAPDPTYTENDPPLQLDYDENVTIVEPEGDPLLGTTITLSIQTNCVAAEDVLAIGNYGTITTSGANVLDGGTAFGTFTGGNACNPLVITLNALATDASMTALARAFTYENISNTPDTVNVRRMRLQTDQGTETHAQSTKYLTVVAANDAPLITFAAAPTSANEQVWTIMDGTATVADPDAGPAIGPGVLTAQITNMYPGDRLNVRDQGTGAGQIGRTGTLYANPGTISYGGTNIGVFTWAGSTATITLNASATIPAVEALVQNIQFIANVNNPNTTQRVVEFTITDSAGDTSPISTKLVNVVPVNDDPVVSNFSPDITYIENAAAMQIDDDVSILDPEYTNYNGGALTVSFSANGTVDDQLAIGAIGNITTSGASVIYAPPLPATWSCTIGSYSGGVNGANLVVNFDQSDQCAINSRIGALLQALTYSNPSENPAATRTVQIVVTDGDGGTSAAVTKVINVTAINDEPFFTMGVDQPVSPALLLEDAGAQSVPNWATNIDDGDLGTQILTFTLSNDNNGLFSTPPAIAADGTLTYTLAADANGFATVTVEKLQDDGGTANGGDDTYVPASNTFTITVTAVNDEPSFTSGGNVTVAEDSGAYNTAWATAISAGPADESGQTLTFTVTNDDNTLFSVQPDINPATGNLSFTPATNANGTATVTVYLADNGLTANGGDDTYGPITFDIIVTAVDDPPVAVDDTATVLEDAAATTIDVLANDTDIIDGGPIAISTVTQPSNGTVVITNSGADLTYEPDADYCYDGSFTDDFIYTLTPGSSAATVRVTVTCVNDEPSFTSGGNVTVAEDSGAYNTAWATAISAGPADESGQTLTFTVTNSNTGLFSTQPDIDEVTGNLSFTPATNMNGSALVTIYLSDNGGTANSGDDSYGPITFTIIVAAANDGPTDIDLDNSTVAENEIVNTIVGNLTTTDIDLPSDAHIYTLVTGVSGCDGSGNASFNINNDDLQTSVVFDYETPPTSFNICIQTEDNGNATYTEEFTITIININEAPVNTVPVAQTTDDNIPLTFSTADGNLISTDDVDAGAADLEVTLVVTSGTLTLNGTTGLSFTVGNGIADATMTFTGTLAEINAALDGLVYTPNLGFSGLDSLSITTDDQGATGLGGAQSDTDTVVIDVVNIPPQVVSAGVNSIPDTGDGVLAEGEVAHVGITSLIVTFNEAMDNTTAGDQVSNPDNYLLLSHGHLLGFQTTSCAQAKNVGVDPGDTQIAINSVTYSGTAPFTVTLNLATELPTNDYYRLYACGTATLRDLAGNALAGDGVNAGSDFIRNFRVRMPTVLPDTGFTPGQNTVLSVQPNEKAYTGTGMTLEIPDINQKIDISGVPETEMGWDVSWLGNNAGYLAGTAFPTWSGNTVLTAHVWTADNQPGPFAELKTLSYGDRFYIHSFGKVYTYEIRVNKLVAPSHVQSILKHENLDWVTLITCESYKESNDTYAFRRVVRAVLVDVK